MRIADFQKKTEAELLQLADDCFVAMDGAGLEQKAAYLLQAQLYMTQAARLGDAQVADRDFRMATRSYKMEKWVLWLIGGEIVLSIFGVWLGFHEGNKQNDILSKLNASATSTATASASQALALPQLVDEQKTSMQSLSDMNDKLKGSLQQTTVMSTAMRDQLKILREEQVARQAELAKKPKLVLYAENVLLTTPAPNGNFNARDGSPTQATFNILLLNSGSAKATRGMMRVLVDSTDVSITAGPSTFAPPIPHLEPDDPYHGVMISFEYLRSGARVAWPITFSYPAGQHPFSVMFNVDADEIETGTPLGRMTITPLKP
jgi:hypothetical protein